MRGLLVTLALLAACDTTARAPEVVRCNGRIELCDRAYDAIAQPGTHDSYSDTDEKFVAPDQTHGIARQLADGIRVLHFEVHRYNGGVRVCHGLCEAGRKPFAEELQHVADFLAANPDEVVTLLLERSDDAVTADDLSGAMASVGLDRVAHVQRAGDPWPTLRTLIRNGDRLVTFLDDTSGASVPWLLPRWAWTWETPWDNESAPDFGRCDADRGVRGNSLYVVDTYMEDLAIESAEHAQLVNRDPFLVDRVVSCQRAMNALPNFVMVNFYEASDLFHVVDVLNGFAPTPDAITGFPPASFDAGTP